MVILTGQKHQLSDVKSTFNVHPAVCEQSKTPSVLTCSTDVKILQRVRLYQNPEKPGWLLEPNREWFGIRSIVAGVEFEVHVWGA